MDKVKYVIRVAEEKDAEAIHDIYGAYTDRNDVTFTVNNPDVESYREKIIHTKEKYPFYVAEAPDGSILGYVCGSSLRPHDAYRWNVESTIILHPDAPRRQGIATKLYEKFFESLKAQNYQYVYAVIVDTNEASIAFHDVLGFKNVGHFTEVGYKDNEWLGIVWMAKHIADENEQVREPLPFK